jgi:hypothetical protein
LINKIKSHLHLKLSLTITVGAVIVATVVSAVFYTSSFKREFKSYENVAAQLIETISYSAAIAVYLNNHEMVSEVAESLLQNDIIANVLIKNEKEVFYESDAKSSTSRGGWIQYIIYAPFSSNEQIGTLSYTLNFSLIEEKANQVALRNAVTLIAHSMLVAILSMVLVYVSLTMNLREIVHILHRIKPGESKERLPLLKGHLHDELGLLVRDTNILLDSADYVINQKEELIVGLEKALQEIKTLQGIIPICSKCRKIKDGEGYWQQVEEYIEKNSEAVFSHGMCKDCTDELYGGLDWYEEARDDILSSEKECINNDLGKSFSKT